MEKTIKLDITNAENLLERYNGDIINHKLIEYIINKSFYTGKNDKIKIIINNKIKTEIDIKEMIIKSLKEEYIKIEKEYYRNNFIQIVLLILGSIILFLSTLFSQNFILIEILVIGGWVPIWEVMNIELFSDFKGRRKKLIILKLIESEFIIQ